MDADTNMVLILEADTDTIKKIPTDLTRSTSQLLCLTASSVPLIFLLNLAKLPPK